MSIALTYPIAFTNKQGKGTTNDWHYLSRRLCKSDRAVSTHDRVRRMSYPDDYYYEDEDGDDPYENVQDDPYDGDEPDYDGDNPDKPDE